jgi:hypothetical protein
MKKQLPKFKKGHSTNTFKELKFSKVNLAIFAIIFVGIGGYFIFHSFAAGFTASMEAENSTVNSPAAKVGDATSSGGNALKFQAAGSGNVCAPYPSFPDANCTGVPAGTTLTSSGGMTISTAGTVINAKDISGPVVINAPNVTIRNSRIHTNAMWIIENNSTGLLVEDSELINQPISGQNNCHNSIGSSNFTIRRSELSGCENGADVGGDNVTLEDNFIHDLDTTGPSYVWGNSPHTDGIQMSPGSDNIIVRHNWIDPSPGGGITSAIIMGVNGSQSNVRIEFNYLDGRGASYAVYANRQTSPNIYINSNKLGKGYGYTACVKIGITVTEFNGNQDLVTGAALTPDNGFDGGCTN